jgi:hypothetical protein
VADPSPIWIKGPHRGAISKDGLSVELQLTVDDGTVLCLRFATAVLENIISRSSSMVADAQSRMYASSGNLELVPVQISEATATRAAGEALIVLSLRALSGWVQHFGLAHQLAARLCRDLRITCASAEAHAKRTLQ